MAPSLRAALRAPVPLVLSDLDPRATPLAPGDKERTRERMLVDGGRLADLQELLYAEGATGGRRRVLLLLQGMDTSGKGGVLRHTIGLVDPQGVWITSFKAPTDEEREHDFLWRIENGLPGAGYVGVFDRSHYEDVLIARVRGLAEPDEIERHYGAINDFEARLGDQGFSLIKCMLHISADEQKARLAERLANPDKHWKYNPGDLDERASWPAYREAYEIALERTSSTVAPWHVVPSDKKWFRNLAIGQLLLDTLRGLDLQWPEADFDVEAETERLAQEPPVQ
jgi:PPK2 family polyphosphate:nucleotide phosphotransferase